MDRTTAVLTAIRDAQACRITSEQALRTLASHNVHGAFNAHGAYTGYDYTAQRWIAVDADGSEPRQCDGHAGTVLIDGRCPDCIVESADWDDSDELGLAEFDRVQTS